MKKLNSLILASVVAVSAVAQQTEPAMVLTLKNGDKIEYKLAEVDNITFRTPEETPAVAIGITVDKVTVNTIKATFKADDPQFTFLFGIVEKGEFDSYANDEAFLNHEVQKHKDDAESYGMSLAEYFDFLLGMWEPDQQVLNRDNLKPDTEYYLYAYGMNTKGEVTSGLTKQLVSTKGYLNVAFNLGVTGITSTGATITATPDNTDTYYYLGFIAKNEYDNEFKGDEAYIINNALATVRMAIGSDGSRLGEVATVRKGNGEQKLTGLTPDMEYYAIAFSIDETVSATSLLTKTLFKTEPVKVVDDCTFAISTTSVTPMLINLDVKPSNATTRYFVTIRKTADVASLTPGQVADQEVAFQNGFNPPINWSSDSRVFTGNKTLNSRKDLGVTIIMPQTEYTVYAFGVSTQGVRTTEVATFNVTTPAATQSQMTLAIKDVTADGETDPNDWAGWGSKICFFSYTVTPSDNDQYYYTGVVKKSDYEKYANDEAFMADVIKNAGELIMMNCYMGENNGTLTTTPAPFKATADYAGASIVNGEEYCIFAFGYAGMATTPLFKSEITASDGTTGGGWGW